ISVLKGRDLDKASLFAPALDPMSMTSTLIGPEPGVNGAEWLRKYLVFLVPRPWTFWSRCLPESLRPGRTVLLTWIGIAAAAGAFALMAVRWPRASSAAISDRPARTRTDD